MLKVPGFPSGYLWAQALHASYKSKSSGSGDIVEQGRCLPYKQKDLNSIIACT